MDDRPEQSSLDFSTRLALEFDPRLAEVWTCVFGLEAVGGEVTAHLASLLRMAYLRGYQDALSEPERGELLMRLGAPVPPRRSRGRPGVRKGGPR